MLASFVDQATDFLNWFLKLEQVAMENTADIFFGLGLNKAFCYKLIISLFCIIIKENTSRYTKVTKSQISSQKLEIFDLQQLQSAQFFHMFSKSLFLGIFLSYITFYGKANPVQPPASTHALERKLHDLMWSILFFYFSFEISFFPSVLNRISLFSYYYFRISDFIMKYSILYFVLQNIKNKEVVVCPDYIIYGDTYCAESRLTFSCSCIKLEGSTINGSKQAFSFEWAVEDIVNIKSDWYAKVRHSKHSIDYFLNCFILF